MTTVGLYVHIPFCQAKCAYCDFNSYPDSASLFAPYLAALNREMVAAAADVQSLSAWSVPPSKTLYIGGGTPTILPAPDLEALISTARQTFALPADAEVTVEANPGTVRQDVLHRLRRAGANRLSLGVQSFDDGELCTLGRIHTAQEVQEAIQEARLAGFDNINLDLMFGLPGQVLADWQKSVRQALEWRPRHLSLYALTLEEGTPLKRKIEQGQLSSPDDDLAADMYEWAEDMLDEVGYVHYEISNWALPGYVCQHNLVYWHNEPYIGLGAGAHSWWKGKRWANLAKPAEYVAQIEAGRPPVEAQEIISPALEMGETMMMGLRLLEEGVSLIRFQERFGVSLDDVYAVQVAEWVQRGLLERVGGRIRLTPQGHLLGNPVFAHFLPE